MLEMKGAHICQSYQPTNQLDQIILNLNLCLDQSIDIFLKIHQIKSSINVKSM